VVRRALSVVGCGVWAAHGVSSAGAGGAGVGHEKTPRMEGWPRGLSAGCGTRSARLSKEELLLHGDIILAPALRPPRRDGGAGGSNAARAGPVGPDPGSTTWQDEVLRVL